MKLSLKLLVISLTIVLLFTISTNIPAHKLNPGMIWLTAASLFIFMVLLIYNWLILPIAELNQKLIELALKFGLQKDQLPTHRDEIKNSTALIKQISTIEKNPQLLANEDQIKFLQTANKLLEEEINTLSSHLSKEQKFSKSKKDNFSKLAHYDELTALPNRVFFNEILNKSISHAKRHKTFSAILLIDIIKFKNINETYGKDSADLILKEISSRLSKTLRSDDILARLDSDEFIVLLNNIGKPKFASSVAEKLIAAYREPFKLDGQNLSIGISIGICIFPTDGRSLEELLTHVEVALNKAKLSSGSQYQFYTQTLDDEARKFKELDLALKQSIKNNELTLHYQPKLQIKKGRITGVEALIRWSHPTLGDINPNTFIPLAEETGFIREMGEWAVLEACKTNKHWQMEGYEHITMSINLSAKQFNDPNMPNIIQNALIESGLNPNYLEIEINESTVMDKVEEANVILNKFKSIGIQVSIDHFGTGYTSINYLKKFPISTLKIDQSFIKGLPVNPNDIAITSAFISLAHHLALEVVASGVETAEQVQFLSDQNCDLIQGYFLSHPLPADKIVKQFTKLSDEVLL